MQIVSFVFPFYLCVHSVNAYLSLFVNPPTLGSQACRALLPVIESIESSDHQIIESIESIESSDHQIIESIEESDNQITRERAPRLGALFADWNPSELSGGRKKLL